MSDPIHPSLAPYGAEIQRIEREADAKRAELEEAIAKAKDLQRTLSGLQRNVDDCADRLTRADAQFSSFKANVEAMRSTIHETWGVNNERAYQPTSPDYSALIAFEAAVADYPRVRKIFQQNVANAEAALHTFERKNFQAVS